MDFWFSFTFKMFDLIRSIFCISFNFIDWWHIFFALKLYDVYARLRYYIKNLDIMHIGVLYSWLASQPIEFKERFPNIHYILYPCLLACYRKASKCSIAATDGSKGSLGITILCRESIDLSIYKWTCCFTLHDQ